MSEPPTELMEFLAPYPAVVQETCFAAREMMMRLAPDATEVVVDATNIAGTCLTYTHTFAKGFCFASCYPKHVILGFPWGADLSDPELRLRGGGKRVRHIRLLSPSVVEDAYLEGLVLQSIEAAFRPDPPLQQTVAVVRYKGPKKRPNKT